MTGRLTPFFPSRRQFLGLVAASTLVPSRGRLTAAAAAPLFEEIPPSVSGISWTHENAMSPDRYLPETMGPGVGFVDYDNDVTIVEGQGRINA
jgi:enediyne biosynthesis protein E4